MWLTRRALRARNTVRLRLTATYGATFLVTGAALLAVTYLLVRRSTASVVVTSVGQGVTSLTTGGANPPSTSLTTNDAGASGGPRPSNLPDPANLLSWAENQHHSELHQLLVQSGIALAIMAVVAVVVGWLVAGRALRPLRTMTARAREISLHRLDRRLAVEGPDDELKDLADTVDGLLGRLEAAFEAQRRFVANASHELRTPLTVGRTLIEVALADPAATPETLRDTCSRVLAVGEQQERMLEALLVLTRSERGLAERTPVDLSVVARQVVAAREAEAARRGFVLDARLDAAGDTSGNADLLERLVANLVDNALRHNVSGGRVEVLVRTDGEAVSLRVGNDGPVVPAGEVDRLFQPFQRLGGRTGDGHGLGLSIVAAVAQAHDASVTATPRAAGGLDVEVVLAAARLAVSR